MSSYKDELVPSYTLVDQRDQIGPHHLGIGKTKKIFQFGKYIYAFFSTGYQINYAVLDAETLDIVARHSLRNTPVAWGGGQFCIELRNNQVHLAYTTRNRLTTAYMNGAFDGTTIRWQSPEQAILGSTPTLAAPWVEIDHDGNAWASTVGRDGNFHVAYKPAMGIWQQRPLFNEGEEAWMHSCVQLLPTGASQAVAVGFRGDFPHDSELVYKSCDGNLEFSNSETLAPCNVNDQLTFHFQAVGDSERKRAHIVYLADNLHVDHAHFENDRWTVEKNMIPTPAFAPQICLGPSGEASTIAVDYDGQIHQNWWSSGTGWSDSKQLDGTPQVTISPAYGRTGYGTGGLIAATRTLDGTIPYITGCVDLDPRKETSLYVGSVGHLGHLDLSGPARLAQSAIEGHYDITLSLNNLNSETLGRPGYTWAATFPAGTTSGDTLNVRLETSKIAAPILHVELRNSVGQLIEDLGPKSTLTIPDRKSIYSGENSDELVIQIPLNDDHSFQSEGIAETYRNAAPSNNPVISGELVDQSPFIPEPNSIVGRDPASLPKVFRRLL